MFDMLITFVIWTVVIAICMTLTYLVAFYGWFLIVYIACAIYDFIIRRRDDDV